MKRKICSIFLALVLLSLPHTFATGAFLEAELELTGEIALPEEPNLLASQPVISVRVPDSGWVVVNPYGLEVERDGVVSSEQIVSPALALENQSEIPVRVDAQAVGRVPADSGAVFVPSPPAPDAAAKEIFMYLEFQPFRNWETIWSGSFTDDANQLAVSAAGEAKSGVLRLEAGGQGAFRAFGSVNTSPVEPWNELDAVGVSVLFTFSPEEEQSSAPPLDMETMSDGEEEPFEPVESTENTPVDQTDATDTVEPPGTPPPLEPWEEPEQGGI